MTVRVRAMRAGDHSALVDLWSRFPGNTMTGADGPEGFREFLRVNGGFCFVAEEDGRVVGSVMAGTDGRRGYVYHLAVEPGRQKEGLGGRLMEHAEKGLREAGIEKAHLFIYGDNPAIGFYLRVGWHLREDIEVMSKVLIGERYMGTRVDGE